MNTSRQLTDLIKNKARSLGIDAQLLLKRYFMEQMLARIAVSKYKTNIILKGGLLVYLQEQLKILMFLLSINL